VKFVTGYDGSYLAIICVTSNNFQIHLAFYLRLSFIDGREVACLHHSLWQLFVISIWFLYISYVF
jgi:hypothetical protein